MKITYVLALLTGLFIFQMNTVHAQKGEVEDENCTAPSKKSRKLIAEAKSPDTEMLDKLKNFKKAMSNDPDKAEVHYEYALFQQYRASQAMSPGEAEKSRENAHKSFLKVAELCHDYHADVYYNIALYYYNQEDRKNASKYFKKFIEFDHPSAKKYSRNHDQLVSDVNEILPEIQFYDEFYNHPVPFEPSKVTNVSSQNDEYLPMISPDNELIFYTRKLDRRNKGDLIGNVIEEFTLSRRPDIKSQFNGGAPFKRPFNDPMYNNFGGVSLSVDNKEMIICACKTEEVYGQTYNNCDLYSTTYRLENGEYVWTDLINLGPNINSNDGWEGQPSLSPNGKTLYYATNRKMTAGTDIYVSERNDDGSWQRSKPIGGGINTESDDKSPFLHQDSETLYFVSQCSPERLGAGGFDIFYTQKKEDGTWVEPKNIGYPINSTGDEVGLFVSTDGRIAYFASNRLKDSRSWDIYSFELYEQARPKKVVLVKGELKSEDGQPIEDASIQVTYSETGEEEEIKVNGNDGKYAVVVKAEEEQDVLITVKKNDHAFDSKLVEPKSIIAENKSVIVKGSDLKVEKIEEGKPYTINDILFATASSDLNKKSKFILDNFAQFLKENPTIKISINGHTDNEGNAADNMTLSQDRADAVKTYLASKGISKDRLKSKGFGQTQPKVPNTSAANKAQNRRTDFVILSK